MKDKRTLRRLKWLTVVVPPLLAWLYETVRHSLLENELDGWPGNLLAGLLILVCSWGFAQVVFGLVNRLQQRLMNQNRQLKQLNRQVRELAVVEERSRLSREMHDGLAQLLAYVMLKIDLIETLLRLGRLHEAGSELEQVRKACNDGYEDVREAITGLRPEFFDGRDFLTILNELLEGFSDKNDLKVGLTVKNVQTDSPQVAELFPTATVVQLFRVVQEALNNIRKHSQARSVGVEVALLDQATADGDTLRPVVLTIQDDGQGFDSTRLGRESGHFGYIIMRERVESLDGRLRVDSQAGHGTTLRIELPVKPQLHSEGSADLVIEPTHRVAQISLN